MDTHQVKIGTIRVINGMQQDDRRPVEFDGDKLANRTTFTGDDDTRGVTETLYKTDSERYVVFAEDWSRWQSEPSFYTLLEVTESDLQVGGRYESLGRKASMGRPLTLDEALVDHEADFDFA